MADREKVIRHINSDVVVLTKEAVANIEEVLTNGKN